MPFVPQVHIDQALTTISIAYTQEELVGDRIFPVVGVDKRSGRYFVYGREAWRKRDDIRRPGSNAIEITRTLSTDFFNAEEHAQKEFVSYAEIAIADQPLQPEVDATETTTMSVQNNREIVQLGIASDPTQVTQNLTLSGTTQWSDYTNSVPLTNLKTAKQTVRLGVGRRANMFSVAYEVALTLADHPSIKDLIKYTEEGNIQESGLPATLRGLKVNEVGALYDSANEGQAVNFTTIFGKSALVHFTDPAPGLRKISFGYTFEAPDDLGRIRGFYTRTFEDEGAKGKWVETANTYVPKVVAPLGAYLFVAAIA